MKNLLKGVLNYHFKSDIKDPIFEYKKIGHVLAKIHVKLKLLMEFIPKDYGPAMTIFNEYDLINEEYVEKKKYTYLKMLNEQDDLSDDDKDIINVPKKAIEKIFYVKVQHNSRKSIDRLIRLKTKNHDIKAIEKFQPHEY